MSLFSLHPIELQLIAHFLPVREILSFARRCRFTLHALDAPFTFRCDALKVHTKDWLPGAFSPERRLMRHVRVSLVWSKPPIDNSHSSPPCVSFDVDALLCMAAAPVSTVGLDATQWGALSMDDSSRLLSALCMRQLRELRLNRLMGVSDTGIKALGAMSQLRSLQMSAASPALLQSLAGLPRLSDLSVWFGDRGCFESCLEGIGALSGLRSLHLGWSWFHGGCWLPFWLSVRALESVSIEGGDCDPDGPDEERPQISDGDFAAAFRAMECMRCFQLKNAWSVDRLLSHIHHAPALRRLQLIALCDALDEDDDGNSLPTPSVLQSLMSAAPALIVSIEILSGSWSVKDRRRAEQWQSRYNDQQAQFGPRLQIELTVEAN